jgi:hypothetical protein
LKLAEPLLSLSVTDVRFYELDRNEWRLKPEVVSLLGRRMRGAAEVFLSVGLTRAWSKGDDEDAYHWLQVNNIHLAGQPIW